MRAGGFHACSFREIATDVGIKSASVHHHFPAKADLGAALVARYTARVLAMFVEFAATCRCRDSAILRRLQRLAISGFRRCGRSATRTESPSSHGALAGCDAAGAFLWGHSRL